MQHLKNHSIRQACRMFAAAVVVMLLANVASATVHTLEAFLDGLQETPPNASPAFGHAIVSLDDVSGAVTITTGTYQGLLGGASAIHIHGLAPPGTPAGVLIGLTLDTPGAMSGTFSGGSTLSGANVTGMLNGDTYVNLHSSVFPGGEIRGQLISVVPEPSTIVLGGLGALGMLMIARRRRR